MATPSILTATSRAARLVSGLLSQNSDDYHRPIREAGDDAQVVELVLALGLRCAALATELYGDRAQAELDGFSFDALAYEDRLRGARP